MYSLECRKMLRYYYFCANDRANTLAIDAPEIHKTVGKMSNKLAKNKMKIT